VDSSVVKQSTATGQKLGTTELLYRCAQEMGLQPSWVTPNGMFAISVGEREKYVHFARSPLNSHTGASLAKDKYLTRLVLERHGMQNIPFAQPQTQAEAARFLQTHRKIVAKPIYGHGAHDIHVITTGAQLRALTIRDYILEKYITGQEMRYLILNDTVIGVHRSDYGTSVEATRALERISYPSQSWNPALTASSVRIAQILDLKFAAVDYLIDASGHAFILEVNTTPGLKWFHAPTSGPVVDVARQFLEATVS
jgi:glutathione synthase/RimK-type ligase-like ATP-grasp enzyme